MASPSFHLGTPSLTKCPTFAGAFSASTAPSDSLLTLRPLWPRQRRPDRTLQAIVETKAFFTQRHVDQATRLLQTGSLGLDKLHQLMELICIDDHPPSTPKRTWDSLGENLGPFATLVSLDQLSRQRLANTSPQGEPLPTPSRAPKSYKHQEVAIAVENPLYTLLSKQGSPSSPSPPAVIDSAPDGQDRGVADPRPVSIHLPTAIARTPVETLVVDFLVTLTAGIATLIQPLGRRPVCVANAFERTFVFGPVSGETTSNNPAGFSARIDGDIPRLARPASSDGGLVVVFEAKRARRGPGDVAVRAQQSMEHAAVIWERHKGYKVPRHYTLMIAQDATEIFLTIATYDETYLDYLFGSPSALVLPSQSVSTIPFLVMQEFGPFELGRVRGVDAFAHIVLALLLWAVGRLGSG
ncbi:hypothetical protein B0T16DRAFT_319839 [Cercophora newfieldiana]|uniref:Uncharacterized protein n=1 Tax=Cercophora newfieldiana TaxID=92897 RepID=A0AA40CXU1_9PEZI|nr:hypothetical protein B0T16DRAFT_319839 [Cercophora newfieldiana]